MINEYIRVRFANPTPIQQVAIAESKNPGAIAKIFLFNEKGKKNLIYENKNPSPLLVPQRLFLHKFTKTNYNVAEIRVELKTKAVPGFNFIDAIGISTSRRSIKIEVDELEYNNSEILTAENLGLGVNSPFAERLPIISPDGQTLYFARKYHPQNIGEEDHDDIWVSYRQSDDTWSRAVNMGAPLNNKTHNFVIAVNPTEDILYLANDYKGNAKDAVSISKKKGRSWQKPKTLDIDDHYNKNDFVGYYVNMAGDILLMSVERKEGIGERDLYVSFKDGKNQWSKPRSLGPTINSVNDESSIFLAADGKTIYFSSNGHGGYGGLDMFMSKRLDHTWTKWTKPKNLGKKFNSPGNDYNYTIPASGEYAYFSSDDPNGMSDIYRIKLPKEIQPDPVMMVSGRILDAETKKPIRAKIKYRKLGKGNTDLAIQTKDDGAYQLVLPFGEDVGVHAEFDGYFSVSESLQLSDNSLEQEDYDDSEVFASIDNNVENKEVEQLQLRLNKLNKEIEDIQVHRKKAKEQISQSRKKRKATTRKSHKSDPELDALKDKFDRLRTKKSVQEIQNNRKVKKRKPATNSENTELEAMRNKLSKHHKDSNTRRSPNKKFKYNDDRSSELDDMKAKLNKHHNKDVEQKEEKVIDEEEEVIEEQEEPIIEEKEEEEEILEEEEMGFEEIEGMVREELTSALKDRVKIELQIKLIPEIKKELADNIVLDLSKAERSKLKYDKVLLKELTAKLKKRTVVMNSNEGSPLMQEIKNDLYEVLEEEVRKDLQKDLYDSTREELFQEMDFRLKKEIGNGLRKALDDKVKTQEKEEKKKRNSKTTTPLEAKRTKPLPEKIAPPTFKTQKTDILLIPIKEGQIIPMNNIFFEANKASIKDKSNTELLRVALFLEQNKNMVVEIGGHTNGWCSHEFASELSRSRAKAVTDYLINQGISENQIQYKGYGKTAPIASNDTLIGRKKNQRVEMKILEIK